MSVQQNYHNNNNNNNNKQSSKPHSIQFRKSYLDDVDGVIFDCDGVLWHEDDLIEGAKQTIQHLYNNNKKILFCSNNSSKSRSEYINKIKQLELCPDGMNIDNDIFYCSSYAAAHYLVHQTKFDINNDIALTVGGNGIADECRLYNIDCIETNKVYGEKHISKKELIDMKLDNRIHAVIAGIDDKFTYTKCCIASIALLQHGLNNHNSTIFISTNQDRTLPTAGHLLPGGGSVVAMISTASSVKPINVGKPESYMLDIACKQHNLDRNRTLMIGDRLDTDILFGNSGNIKTLLLTKTGVSRIDDIHKEQIYPTYVCDSVADMIK